MKPSHSVILLLNSIEASNPKQIQRPLIKQQSSNFILEKDHTHIPERNEKKKEKKTPFTNRLLLYAPTNKLEAETEAVPS